MTMKTLKPCELDLLKLARRRQEWVKFSRDKETVKAICALAGAGLVEWTIEQFIISEAGFQYLHDLEHAKGFQTSFIPED